MNDLLTGLLDAVQSIAPVWRVLLAGLAMLLETSVLVGLFVPGDTIVIVTGTAVGSFWEGAALVAAIVVGSVIGESIGFWLGRVLGPRIRHSWLGRWIGEAHWQRAERYLARRGGLAILISRFLPVLHSVVPLTVGMSGYRYRRFLAWTVPACVVWAGIYVTVASIAAGTYRDLADNLHFAGYIFVGVIVAFLLVVIASKKLIERIERRHLVADAPAATAPEAMAPASTDTAPSHVRD
ncbi:DedA family protein [Microbacterium protaetiae]|uniref:DedA family protein n=1 Tax=Microbacterium protaetiae TaxID=2509458 RepID=A0A4P6EIH6_9MICO|nr:DedA family protein [Microbacterium protaetiae]QAY61373.1 DedA family protein [Microbacterium protaetiae]